MALQSSASSGRPRTRADCRQPSFGLVDCPVEHIADLEWLVAATAEQRQSAGAHQGANFMHHRVPRLRKTFHLIERGFGQLFK